MGRSDLQRVWGGRAVAEGAVGPDRVVLAAPALDADRGLGQGGEDLRVETLVAERAGEGFPRPVLPGTARCDEARGHAEPLQPGAHRSRGARRAGVGAEGGRRAALHEARRPPGEDVVGAQAPGDVAAEAPPRARVHAGPQAQGPAVRRPLVDKVVGPDGVRPLRSAPRAGAVHGPEPPPPRGVAGHAQPLPAPERLCQISGLAGLG